MLSKRIEARVKAHLAKLTPSKATKISAAVGTRENFVYCDYAGKTFGGNLYWYNSGKPRSNEDEPDNDGWCLSIRHLKICFCPKFPDQTSVKRLASLAEFWIHMDKIKNPNIPLTSQGISQLSFDRMKCLTRYFKGEELSPTELTNAERCIAECQM